MPETQTPAENAKGLTIREALLYLEKKLNNKEYQNVIDGCNDILHVDPTNKKAQKLLKKTEGKMRIKNTSKNIKPKIITVMVCIIMLGIGTLWHWNKKEKPIITHNRTEDQTQENTPEANERKIHNEQRLTDLTKIQNALKEAYKRDHEYPDAKIITEILKNGGFIETIPHDPLNGKKNTDGTVFSYMYAVYNNVKGGNQEYILSALFEESNDKNIVWTLGAKTTDHTDYRDESLDNVKTIE